MGIHDKGERGKKRKGWGVGQLGGLKKVGLLEGRGGGVKVGVEVGGQTGPQRKTQYQRGGTPLQWFYYR